jgi:phosphoribosylaminoimidazole-succinocarboxamide synthase
MENVRFGSTRIMTPYAAGEILVKYTEGWSAFDRGTSKQLIPGIGAARCACAIQSFRLMEKAGIPTHFIEQVSATSFNVQEFAVPFHGALSGRTAGHVLICEWIYRMYLDGSLWDRVTSGHILPETLGFSSVEANVLTKGTLLPRMRLECTTKFESVDRHLTDDEARALVGITQKEWEDVHKLVKSVVLVTDMAFRKAGFYRPDGKMEVGMTNEGKVVIVDVCGTQDEDRIVDKETGELFSKDLIRNHLKKNVEWMAALKKAKVDYPDDKAKWPEYPTLPDELVDLVSKRYAEVALRYPGVRV